MRVKVAFGLSEKLDENLVVVDVFRSSTSIVIALENGAEEIIPCSSLDEARRLKRKLGDEALLVGERRGLTPKGFDLNISPNELTRDRVGGKKILYCSTNLVRAIYRGMKTAKHLLVGGLVNANAVARYLRRLGVEEVSIIACGLIPDKLISLEDVVGAGAIISRLGEADLSDTAIIAELVYENKEWRRLITKSHTAKYLQSIGWGGDIELCLTEDLSNIVPVVSGGAIRGVRVE